MKPPLIINLFSGFFVFLGMASLASLLEAESSVSAGKHLSIGILTAKVDYLQNPEIFAALSLLLIFGGLVGLLILLRYRYAYDVGILYAAVSLLLLGSLAVFDIGRTNDLITCIVTLLLTFGWFLFYLIRNRSQWRGIKQQTPTLLGDRP